VLLPDEDHEEHLRFARRLVHAYSPNGVLEEEAARTIIEGRWQMRRANLVDSELFQSYRFYKGEDRGVGTAFAHDAAQANAFSKLTRYHSFLLRKLQMAEKDLEAFHKSKYVSADTITIFGDHGWKPFAHKESNGQPRGANHLFNAGHVQWFKWNGRTNMRTTRTGRLTTTGFGAEPPKPFPETAHPEILRFQGCFCLTLTGFGGWLVRSPNGRISFQCLSSWDNSRLAGLPVCASSFFSLKPYA
jgi:hypothetical protein